jgi:hypothetical protein
MGIIYAAAFIPCCCLAGHLIDIMGNELAIAMFTTMAICGSCTEAFFVGDHLSYTGVLIG